MKLRKFFLVFGLLLCLCLGTNALEPSGAIESARQAEAAANDNAISLQGREEALKQLSEAVRLFLSAGAPVEAARVLNRVGRLQLKLNSPQNALASHNQAISLLKQTPSLEVEVDALNGLGDVYLLLKQKQQLQEVLGRSLRLSQQAGYKKGEAQALLTLSDIQNYEDHAIALQTAQRALALWQTLDDRSGLARTYAQVGRCYMAQSALAEATQNYETALQLWRDINEPSQQAEVLIMLGFIDYRKGDWQGSITYLTQAQSLIDEKAEPLKMGQVAAGLAEAFNENGLPEVGLPYYEKALAYYRQTQDPHLIDIGLLGAGATHYLLGNYAEAKIYFEQVLALADADSLEAASSHRHLGRVAAATGEYSEALSHFQKALAIYTTAHNPREAGQVTGLIGQVYQQQGRLENAKEYYQQTLKTFDALSDRLNQAAVYFALGRLELQQANYDAALNYLRQSIDFTDNIRRNSTSRDLTAAFSATVHNRYETYIECLMRKHDEKPGQRLDIRAFETSDLARGRSLSEMLRANQTNLLPGLDSELAKREKTLRQALRVKENYKVSLLARQYKREELTALESELGRLDAEYKQVTNTIAEHYPVYAQINQPTGWDLQSIQERVIADDQTVLLEYSLGADHSYVWAVTRSDIKSYELPAEAQINTAATKVYGLLATAGDPQQERELSQASQELSQQILLPVAAALNKQRVIVVADGALNYIPFQFLPAPGAAGDPLVANHDVINVPSASILGQLRQETVQRQAPTKLLAAFGDPVFASNYAQRKALGANDQIAALQNSEEERWRHALRDIQPVGDSVDPTTIQPLIYATRELVNLQAVAGSDSLMVTGFDATRENLESLDLTKFAILHFATHGVLDPKHPENSGLFLSMVDRNGESQNGFVGLENIYGLHTPVDLVVLSACSSGLGKDVRGEGLIGLTRGFMYAGASSVVASLWKVDDEATAELMKRFYTNMLQHGMTPAAALRAAQNSIRQEPQWRAPYFWAAFTLQGEYRQVIGQPSARTLSRPEQIRLGAVLVLLLLAVGGWWYRGSRVAKV